MIYQLSPSPAGRGCGDHELGVKNNETLLMSLERENSRTYARAKIMV
jgi:hypothetical protein